MTTPDDPAPTPGPELDALFFRRVEGASVRKITDSMPEYVQGRDWAQPGDYVIDLPDNSLAQLCPAISEDDSVALAALERFAERHNAGWDIERMLLGGKESRYSVFVYGSAGPHHAPTLAMAITRALLAAVEGGQDG